MQILLNGRRWWHDYVTTLLGQPVEWWLTDVTAVLVVGVFVTCLLFATGIR